MTDKNEMTAKQYLSQAYRLDERINSKLDQLRQLKAMATNISLTSGASEVHVQTSHNNHQMEDTVLKIIEQEQEINNEIDSLVDLKVEMRHLVDKVPGTDHRLLLEKRYLLFEDWSQIAVDLNMSVQHTFRLHKEALRKFENILKDESK